MFVLRIVLLLLSVSTLTLALNCYDASMSVSISRTVDSSRNVSYSTRTYSTIQTEECATDEICGFSSGSALFNVVGGTRTFAYTGATAKCTSSDVCQLVTNSNDNTGCLTSRVNYYRYYPLSCNATNNYDLVIFNVWKRYIAGCCDQELCTRSSIYSTYANCTSDDDFGDYISALHTCWTRIRFLWRLYFLCYDSGIAINTYVDNCFDSDGNWERSGNSTSCLFRPRCRSVLKAYITTFGACACTAADTYGRSGALIGSLMEDLFSDYCPNIDFSCSTVRNVTRSVVRRRLRRRRYRVRFMRLLTMAERATLRAYLYSRLRLRSADDDSDADSQSIVFVNSTNSTAFGGRRRLLTDVTDMTAEVEYEYDDGYDEFMNDVLCNLTTEIADLYNTSGQLVDCTAEYVYSTVDNSTSGSYSDDDMDGGGERGVFLLAIFMIVHCSLYLL